MGTCYRIIITWKQKIPKNSELSKEIINSFTEEIIMEWRSKETKLGENHIIFTWCEHDDEYWALIKIVELMDLFQKKGVQFESCFLDNLDKMAYCYSELKEDKKQLNLIDNVLKKIKNISEDDYKSIKKLHQEFNYRPNNLSKEVEEKVFDITYFKLPSGEKSPYHYLKENKVFCSSEILSKADPKSFKVINEFIAKDNKRVYFMQHITEADPNNLRLLQDVRFGNYFTDEKHVYYCQHKMDADPSSFEVLKSGFSKDKNNVYYSYKKLPGADSESFIVVDDIPERCGYDKNYVFLPDKKLKIQTKNGNKWTMFARGNSDEIISADSNHIYENEKPITDFGLDKIKIEGNYTNRVIITPSGKYRFDPNKKRLFTKNRFKQLFVKI